MLSMKFTRLDCSSKSNAASSQRGTNEIVAERARERERERQKVSLFLGLDKFGVPKSMLRKCEKIHRVKERETGKERSRE